MQPQFCQEQQTRDINDEALKRPWIEIQERKLRCGVGPNAKRRAPSDRDDETDYRIRKYWTYKYIMNKEAGPIRR